MHGDGIQMGACIGPQTRGHQLHYLKHPEGDVGIGPRVQCALIGDPEGAHQRDIGRQGSNLGIAALQQATAGQAVTMAAAVCSLRRSRAEKRSYTL